MEGLVEDFERGSEGGLSIWRFVLRPDAGVAVAVEIRGSEIHGALRNGDRVEVPDTNRIGGVLCPHSLLNQTLQLTVSAERPGRARQLATRLGTTVVTAVISTLVSAGVTALVVRPGGGSSAPPSGATAPAAPSITLEGLFLLAAVLFVLLWLLWFVIWGRRWHGGLRFAGTVGIALGALLAIPVGLAVR